MSLTLYVENKCEGFVNLTLFKCRIPTASRLILPVKDNNVIGRNEITKQLWSKFNQHKNTDVVRFQLRTDVATAKVVGTNTKAVVFFTIQNFLKALHILLKPEKFPLLITPVKIVHMCKGSKEREKRWKQNSEASAVNQRKI